MRRSLMLSCCIVLLSAMAVQAEMMNGTGDLAYGDFTYTRTPVVFALGGTATGTSVTLDRIDISYAAAPLGAPGAKLQGLTGTYAVLDGNLNAWGVQYTYNWKNYTTNYVLNLGANSNPVHGISYVNFESTNTGATWAMAYAGGLGYGTYNDLWDVAVYGGKPVPVLIGYDRYCTWNTGITGAWYTSVEANKLEAGVTGENLLAQLYVDQGKDVTVTGTWDFGGTTLTGGITTVPEPATLALAGMGLIGLLCYAWRKRG